MHRKLHAVLFFTFILATAATGQERDHFLPRYATEEEKALTARRSAPGQADFTPSDPPAGPVRSMAEWEELEAVLIAWQGTPSRLAILAEIVRAAREECRVIVTCDGANAATTIDSATSFLQSKNVDLSSNVELIIARNNSIWIRDYGPNTVYLNDVDSLYMVDWIYNRDRYRDDSIATTVAPYLGIPLYRTQTAPFDLVHTGGNFMSDGFGTAFSSKLVLDENGPDNTFGQSNHSEAEIDAIVNSFMGITRYPKMEPLPYDIIHHIDMHMKLLDEETLLVGQYPPGIADGPQIEANLQYVLSNYNSVFGTPYKVIRVPMPPGQSGLYPNNGGPYRTYANAVFVNKTIIVPFYEEQYDTTARRIWEQALPGYNIVGIDCDAIIGASGAIHCITKEVGVAAPLRIAHQELTCQDNAVVGGYAVKALLQHRDGIASGTVWYRTGPAEPWQSVALQPDPSVPAAAWWSHVATIPVQVPGITIDYYIEATSNSGKTAVRPMPAPEGYWSFCTELSTGTHETAFAAQFKPLYPNPASAITCLPVETNQRTAGRITVFNTLGQVVETVYDGELPAGASNYFIDAARYAPGTYFVELRTDNGSSVQKMVKR